MYMGGILNGIEIKDDSKIDELETNGEIEEYGDIAVIITKYLVKKIRYGNC